MRSVLLLFGMLMGAPYAFAQSTWLNMEYTYTDFTYKEGDFREVARLAGIRGELGLFYGGMGVSAGGEYQDGMMDFSGTTYTGATGNLISKNYIRDTRLLAHYYIETMIISLGLAQREWYNNLVGEYHRRQTLNYYPVIVTLAAGNAYFKLEYDAAMKGKLGVSMGETGGGARDIDFTQDGGSGFMVEAGLTGATSGKFFYRIFASYRRLLIDAGGSLSDGVHMVYANRGTMDLVSGGLGLSF